MGILVLSLRAVRASRDLAVKMPKEFHKCMLPHACFLIAVNSFYFKLYLRKGIITEMISVN